MCIVVLCNSRNFSRVDVTEDGKKALIDLSQGDMRKVRMISFVRAVYMCLGSGNK